MCRNKINNLYMLTTEESQLMTTETIDHKSAWDNNRFRSFKHNLLTFLGPEQEEKCCYCKAQLNYENNETHIEHIISKDSNGRFTYNLQNLSLSCRNCNSTKKHKKVYHEENNESSLAIYPVNSNEYLIPHPHLDEYDSYIHFFLDFYPLSIGNSSKGENLIAMCGLHRYGVIINKITANYRADCVGIEKKVYDLKRVPKEDILDEVEKILDDIIR